jgi:hypothetical protein
VDEILVVARTIYEAEKEAKGYGLVVNEGKTKYKKSGRRKTN